MKKVTPTKAKANVKTRKRLDPLSAEQRSERMSRIRSRDSKPELALRKMVFLLGYRYRLHDRQLPGRPDLVFPSRRCVIFVHGCFWHQHDCENYRQPLNSVKFWSEKLSGNVLRDAATRKRLSSEGWRVLVVWECELRRDPVKVAWKVLRFLL